MLLLLVLHHVLYAGIGRIGLSVGTTQAQRNLGPKSLSLKNRLIVLVIDTFIPCYTQKAIHGELAEGHIFIAIVHMIDTFVSHLHEFNCLS